MFTGLKILSALILLPILFCLQCHAQVPDQILSEALTARTAFAPEDFSALEQGEAIVKLLPVKDRREVAVCGVIKLSAPAEISLKSFQEALSQANRKSIGLAGRFSTPPNLTDLEHLTLDKRDLSDLKHCAIGDCKLNLSATMIERFQREVNWNAPDNATKANQLFRQMLVEYVQQYLERGDSALIEYSDASPPVRLAEEHQSLLAEILYVNEADPAFAAYLKTFPFGSLPNVENAVSWAKIKFGLKPVIIVTHVATHTSHADDMTRIIVLSKQIYANHYFDASLSLMAVVSNQTSAGTQSYLLYTNHSRAAGLAGSFSKLKHKLVESEAVENLENLLQQTRLVIESNAAGPRVSARRSGGERFVAWFGGLPQLILWLVLVALLGAFFYLVVPLVVQRARLQKKNNPL
ncbi:MAG TPA: hypothetical protein VLN44_13335 [Pyrinomonadaceae bacterium]|nr:hypothetical protein [Pyrinomonadaceae bacterium]